MPMKNPPHPGTSVRYDCLEPLGISVTQGAKILGVTRQTLNNLVNGKAAISPEMAIRLDKAFGGAKTWLRLQAAYDLAQAEKRADKSKSGSRLSLFSHNLRAEKSPHTIAPIYNFG
jgi:antitoxin HigA-1